MRFITKRFARLLGIQNRIIQLHHTTFDDFCFPYDEGIYGLEIFESVALYSEGPGIRPRFGDDSKEFHRQRYIFCIAVLSHAEAHSSGHKFIAQADTPACDYILTPEGLLPLQPNDILVPWEMKK